MENQALLVVAIIIIIVAGVGIIIFRNWQWLLLVLSLQYLGAFILVSEVWRLELAVVKLVAGWVAVAIIGATQLNERSKDEDENWPMRSVFGFFACCFFILLAFSLTPLFLQRFSDFGYYQVLGGILLLNLGSLKLGLSNNSIHIVLGILIVFSGFEILFAVAEKSVLVAGLLAAMNLGLALVGAYLYVSPSWSESRED